ncbi:MAG TPA: SCO family protein, partial [Gammaproteobacteria bacterium]|nr:SCO family protein [Gammaproteobacteria bacterium]
RILFVSVDPARDTVDVLQAYEQAFGPRVTALSGTQEQLRTLTKRYRVSYGFGKPDANGQYEVSHSSAVFIFDHDGAARLLATGADSAGKISIDMKRLLDG